MERDAFEAALAVALDALPRNAVIMSLSYRCCREDGRVKVRYLLGETAPPPLLIDLLSGETRVISSANN